MVHYNKTECVQGRTLFCSQIRGGHGVHGTTSATAHAEGDKISFVAASGKLKGSEIVSVTKAPRKVCVDTSLFANKLLFR